MSVHKTITLEDLKAGSGALIKEVVGEESFQARLFDLGFLPGTRIILVRKAAFGGPLEVKIRSYHLAVRRKDARKIFLVAL